MPSQHRGYYIHVVSCGGIEPPWNAAHQCQLRFPGQGRSQEQQTHVGLLPCLRMRPLGKKNGGMGMDLELGGAHDCLVFTLKLCGLSAAKGQCREGKASQGCMDGDGGQKSGMEVVPGVM